MADGEVSKQIPLDAEWEAYGSDAPTAANYRIWIWTGAARSYLQAGEATLGAGAVDLAGTSLGSGAFVKAFTPIAAMQGFLVNWEASATGPLASYPKCGSDQGLKVTVNDEDDLETEASAASRASADVAEHDITQSLITQLGVASEAQLLGPTDFAIPDSGTSTFVLEFILKDLDQNPVALVDPDSNQVDITALDQAGGAPAGISLAGSPAGRMTRVSQGRYTLVVTGNAATLVDGTQLRFTATFADGGVANIAKWSTQVIDLGQLDTIEAQVNAIRATDVPAIQANVDDVDSDLAALQSDFNSFEVTNQSEHDATQVSILTRESEASAASRASTDQTEHDTTQAAIAAIPATDLAPVISRLDNATYGLAAINTDLDAILARLGLTADVGGTTTAGTAQAKLNAILTAIAAIGGGGGGSGLEIDLVP